MRPWSDYLFLIRWEPPDPPKNPSGFPNPPIEISKGVFANKRSVGSKEFYTAYSVGMDAQLKFDIYAEEYSDEKLIEYEGKRYKVLRTYMRGDLMELTVSDLSEGG